MQLRKRKAGAAAGVGAVDEGLTRWARAMPVLAAAAMAAATALVWWFAADREEDRIRALVAAEADTVTARVDSDLDGLVESIERISLRWTGVESLSEGGATFDSIIVLRDPAVSSVLWLNSDMQLLWAKGPDASPVPGQVEEWLREARDTGIEDAMARQRLTVSRALVGPGGGRSFLVNVPLLLETGSAGVVVCVVDLEDWAQGVIRELGTQLRVLIRPHGLATVAPAASEFRARWAAHRDLRLGELGLHVAMWPSEATLASLESTLPRTVLVGGLVFAMLLGVAIRLGQVEGLRARDVEMTRALQHEVDARRRAEIALEARALALERSNEDLMQFARIISHDLREPLNVIAMHLQLLAEAREDPEAVERHANRARRAGDRMVRMIDGLLAYSRVGGADRSEAVDGGEALRRALANLESSIEESGAAVEADDLPTIEGQPDQLSQLFQNLVGNAIKHSAGRAPRVRIRCSPQTAHWLFRVEDDGPGVPPDKVERIFNLFEGAGRTSGSGVGLAICRRIVESNGGKIWVQTRPGSGSTFCFTWPRDRSREPDRGPAQA